MIIGTCENVGVNFRTLGTCLYWNRRERRSGHLGVICLSGDLIYKLRMNDINTLNWGQNRPRQTQVENILTMVSFFELIFKPPTPDVVFFTISPGFKLRQDRITNKKMSRVSDSSSLTWDQYCINWANCYQPRAPQPRWPQEKFKEVW